MSPGAQPLNIYVHLDTYFLIFFWRGEEEILLEQIWSSVCGADRRRQHRLLLAERRTDWVSVFVNTYARAHAEGFDTTESESRSFERSEIGEKVSKRCCSRRDRCTSSSSSNATFPKTLWQSAKSCWKNQHDLWTSKWIRPIAFFLPVISIKVVSQLTAAETTFCSAAVLLHTWSCDQAPPTDHCGAADCYQMQEVAAWRVTAPEKTFPQIPKFILHVHPGHFRKTTEEF